MFIDIETYTLDSIIKFGKHKGKTICFILNEDPSYLVWASENIKSFKLEQDILDEAIDLAFDRKMEYYTETIGWGVDIYDFMD